jgi:hypothetical protein
MDPISIAIAAAAISFVGQILKELLDTTQGDLNDRLREVVTDGASCSSG